MDLYRLPANVDLSFLGFPQVFDSSICLIEWPERLGKFYPKEYIDMKLKINPDESRNAEIEFIGEKWRSRETQFEELFKTFS
jgi:tRNA threonylcarbamoyladenosine biosynthesis protein TsaE